MRVFVTGATGFIGSAIVPELIAAGHHVLGLARSEEAAGKLTAWGATAHRGDLEDEESLKRGVAAADGVIHAGFIHDFTKFAAMCEIDRRAIIAMGAALEGTGKPLVVTSGIGVLTKSDLIVEADMPTASSPNPRKSEQAADEMAANGVRVSVVRLAPSVHGEGDHHGFVSILANIARQKGVSVYGEQHNSWCAVHRLDAAKLFRLALEKEAAPGTRYHGVAEENVPFKEIATAIGNKMGLPVEAKSADEAAQHFTWFAHFAAMNMIASGKQTQESLGWHPAQIGLIEDIERNYNF